MKTLPIDELPPILKANIPLPETVTKVWDAIQKVIKEIKADKDANKAPKQKYQTLFILSDPKGVLPPGTELTGWVVQLKEGDDAATAIERIEKGAYEFNSTKKGKKNPVKTLGEAIMDVTRKFFKNQEVTIKTKEPVRILVSNNALKNQPKKND